MSDNLRKMMDNLSIQIAGYGRFLISCKYRQNTYKTYTTNTMAVDRIKQAGMIADRISDNGYTLREALMALRNEIMINNELV